MIRLSPTVLGLLTGLMVANFLIALSEVTGPDRDAFQLTLRGAAVVLFGFEWVSALRSRRLGMVADAPRRGQVRATMTFVLITVLLLTIWSFFN